MTCNQPWKRSCNLWSFIVGPLSCNCDMAFAWICFRICQVILCQVQFIRFEKFREVSSYWQVVDMFLNHESFRYEHILVRTNIKVNITLWWVRFSSTSRQRWSCYWTLQWRLLWYKSEKWRSWDGWKRFSSTVGTYWYVWVIFLPADASGISGT